MCTIISQGKNRPVKCNKQPDFQSINRLNNCCMKYRGRRMRGGGKKRRKRRNRCSFQLVKCKHIPRNCYYRKVMDTNLRRKHR
jgi:hypothetical protein